MGGLIALIDPLSDGEKSGLLEYYLAYSRTNVFNPEVVTAFNTLWDSLSMDERTRADATRILAQHYADTYEFTLAIERFSALDDLGVPLDAPLLKDLSYSLFSLGEYENAIPRLIDHIILQSEQGEVGRREYSMLFESYYRTGDYDSAETIGKSLLQHYNDIQDWKDMQQFYAFVGDDSGLHAHLNNARDLGLINDQQEWVTDSTNQGRKDPQKLYSEAALRWD